MPLRTAGWLLHGVLTALLVLVAASPARADRWSEGTPRWFVASASDVGFAYLRPRVSAGYGKPHHLWAGIDANPILSSSATGAYAGVHVEHPVVEFRAGALEYLSFRRSVLPQQDTYDRRDVELMLDGPLARYTALSAELELDVPVGYGAVHSESEGLRVVDTPHDRAVFVESLPAVIFPPWAVRQQLGYTFPVPIDGLSLGVLGETIWIPERDDAFIWRAGVTVRWWLYDNLQLRMSFVPVVASPDHLGLVGGDFGQVAVRWYWATGSRRRPATPPSRDD